jgi:3-hydroxy-9,10-secoandrosta-1,3,5(10)-triene-9,17-dione monooxygenase reductase component
MLESARFRKVLGHYPTGVCVVTSLGTDGLPIGMSVGSFTSVSLDPPLVAFFPDRRSSTWHRIRSTGRFCVNVLGENQEAICKQFATPGAEKFKGISHRPSELGLPILEGVVAWIECILDAVHEAGDHYIAIGEVADLAVVDYPMQPLVFHNGGFRQINPMI